MRWMLIFVLTLGLIGSGFATVFVDLPEPGKVMLRHGQEGTDPIKVANPYNLLVWNVYKHKKNGLMKDLKQLGAKSDLILLQEAMVDNVMVPYFEQIDGLGWVSAISFLDNDAIGTGVTTGSRWKPYWLSYSRSEAREPLLRTPKMVLYALFRVKGLPEDLMVVNIHGINFVSAESFKLQLHQMTQVISDHRGPMIVAGDFNTHSSKRWEYLNDFAKLHGLNVVKLDKDNRRQKLDSVLIRQAEVKSAELLDQVKSSDHDPISLRFIIPSKATAKLRQTHRSKEISL